MINARLILKSHLSQGGYMDLGDKVINTIEQAMVDYGIRTVEAYRSNEAAAINKEAAGLLPSLVRGELKLWIRGWYFKRAKKQAQTLSSQENRKYYVIRSSDVNYKLLSTKDIELNKKLNILGKHVTAMELTSTADFIAHPSQREISKVHYIKKRVK